MDKLSDTKFKMACWTIVGVVYFAAQAYSNKQNRYPFAEKAGR
jgi:hypothetical protein